MDIGSLFDRPGREPGEFQNPLGRLARLFTRYFPEPEAESVRTQPIRTGFELPPTDVQEAGRETAPFSYLAGQLSGGQIAGGVPGPRFGTLRFKDIPEPIQRGTLQNLPARLRQRIQTSPLEYEAALVPARDLPENWRGGIFGALDRPEATRAIRINQEQRPSEIIDTLLHESTHGAAEAAGVFSTPPPGVSLNSEWWKKFSWAYPSERKINREILPTLVANPEHVDVRDREAFLHWFAEKMGKSPREIQRQRHAMKKTTEGGLPAPEGIKGPIQEEVVRGGESVGGVSLIPEDLKPFLTGSAGGKRDWKKFFEKEKLDPLSPHAPASTFLSRAWWNDLYKDLPEYAVNRINAMIPKHGTAEGAKAEIYRGMKAYADRVRGLRKQGEK